MGHLPLAEPPIELLFVGVGVALLFVGRRLFWLGVAALGFVVGLELGARLLGGQGESWVWVLCLLVGILGAILAIALQKAAVAVAGFLLGALGALYLLEAVKVELGPWGAVVVVMVGLLAAVAALALFAVALSVLTAGAGAALIVEAVDLPRRFEAAALGALVVVGAAVQLAGRRRRRPQSRGESSAQWTRR